MHQNAAKTSDSISGAGSTSLRGKLYAQLRFKFVHMKNNKPMTTYNDWQNNISHVTTKNYIAPTYLTLQSE